MSQLFARVETDTIQRSNPAPLPSDTGINAWKFLVGSFLIEAIIWGSLIISH